MVLKRPAGARAEGLTLSIISHGHDEALGLLLDQLAHAPCPLLQRVIVTHNRPPTRRLPNQAWGFELTEVVNPLPAGFGTNHNRAFGQCQTGYFGVLNPDLENLSPGFWAAMVEALAPAEAGCAYPVQLDAQGTPQDSERDVPTLPALWRRYTRRTPPGRVDWVNAACLVVKASAFEAIGGFDERYFLYCEDVDFCLRLQLAGWSLSKAQAQLTHHAQRSSHREGRYLLMHLRSLWRLWTTPVMYRYLRQAGPAPR